MNPLKLAKNRLVNIGLNRAMRLILKRGLRTHIEDMLSKLRWMSIKQRIHFHRAVLMWRIIHGKAPPYLSSQFQFISHQYPTSQNSSNCLFLQKCHSKSLQFSGARIWNDLPQDIRECDSMAIFKKKLTTIIFKNIDRF